MSKLTRAQAEKALAAVQLQFADYLGEGQNAPKLERDWEAPSGRIVDWVISWYEDAPDQWTLHAGSGEGTAAQALRDAVPDLWAEPYTGNVLTICIND